LNTNLGKFINMLLELFFKRLRIIRMVYLGTKRKTC
jgi:hypothetical protein